MGIAGIAALTLIGLIILQRFYKMDPAPIEMSDLESKMIAPRYYGLDEKDRPFELSAKQATQISETDKLFSLIKPNGMIRLGEDKWSKVTADKGLFDQEKQYLTLEHNVSLFRDDGQEYHTEIAYIDFKTGYIYGDQEMKGDGPKGKITSKGFQIYDYGQKYIFNGRAHLTLPMNTVKTNKEQSHGS